MFELKSIERPSMHLNRHWVDYVTLNRKTANAVWLSKTERFRQNTSGSKYGDREYIVKLIEDLANSPYVDKKIYDFDAIYQKLMEKIEVVEDFNVNKMSLNDIRNGFMKYVWDHVVKEIRTKTFKTNKEASVTNFVDENEKESSGEDERLMSTSDILYRNGSLSDEFESVDYDKQRAKLDIIESLEVIQRYNESRFVTTKDKIHINSLRLLQNAIALERIKEESERIENMKGTIQKSHLKSVTSSNKSSGSLGIGDKSYFLGTLKTILHLDTIGERTLLKNFVKFYKAVDYLGVDIIWLDADKIVSPDYIQKLKSAIYDDSVVFVSEEDLQLLDANVNFHDYKVNGVRQGLESIKDLNKREIVNTFNDKNLLKINKIKASELRKISNLSKEMFDDYVSSNKHNSFVGASEGQKRDSDLLKNTVEYYQRVREVETTYLTRGFTLDNGEETKIIPGVLTGVSLAVINKSVDKFFDELLDKDFDRYQRLSLMAFDKYMPNYIFEGKKYKVEEDNNGFLYFNYTDEKGITYRRYITENLGTFKVSTQDNSPKIEMNKWLVNTKGFYVNKFVDGLVRSGKATAKVHYGNIKDGSAFILKDFEGKEIPVIL